MEWKFDYIAENIKPEIIRSIAKLDDLSIKLTMAGLICKLAGNMKLPTKTYHIRIAQQMIKDGRSCDHVCMFAGVSKSTYFKLKRELKNGKS